MKSWSVRLLFAFVILISLNTCKKDEVEVASVPKAPSGLTATASSSSEINLSWTDNSNNETGFKIERSIDNFIWSEVGTVSAGKATYKNSGLSASTTYYFRVRAYNSVGNSNYTSIVSGTTLSAGPAVPTAPSNLSATASSGTQINLSWTDNSNDETGFRIERSADGSTGWSEIATTAANTATYQNTGLTASTIYYYRVRAYNSAGNSTYTNNANATTASASAPTTPSNLTATAASASQINLSWTDNSNNETGFRVERSPDNTTWAEIITVSSNITSYQNTGLTASTTYYYRVRAYNASGNSGYSNTANATTTGTGPTAPSNLTATAASSTQINLSWTDNSNNETGFRIERSPDNSTWAEITTVSANVATYQNTGLAASTTYYYRVRAYNATGNSAYSNTASTTSLGVVPSSPTSLTATAASSSQINLSWTDNSNNETGFRIERSPDNSTWAEITTVSANITTYQNTGLTASTTYYYRVRAYNGVGNSTYTNSANATTQASASSIVLTGPSSATASFNLSWTFTWPGLVSTDDHYELEWSYSSGSGYQVFVTYPFGTRTSPYIEVITTEAIDIGKTTYFRVRAKSNGSYTAYSNVVGVSVPYLNLTFNPTLDNLLMDASYDATLKNKVYASSSLGVGANYIIGLYVNDYLIGSSTLYFNFDNFISGGTIQKATLSLYVQSLPGDWNTTYIINPLAGTWNTNTITFANTPNYYTSPYVIKAPPTSGSVPWQVDITSIVQAWASGTKTNYGILIRDNNIAWPVNTAYRGTDFYSIETAPSGKKPSLYVEIR
ncbi:MAG: fibronectin type III domain-containing protein [Bacteroidia bacterium]|nr:fibronectin type III domain-containing protein [Bacteroidia bacterium]